MKELEFPDDLQCSCVLVFLAGEREAYNQLSRKDIKAKLQIAQRTKKLEEFLTSHSVNPSQSMEVNVELLENKVTQHEFNLAKLYLDGEKLVRMSDFWEFFEKSKEILLIK